MKDQEVAEAERDAFQLGMLAHVKKQTELLSQINMLLWVLATVALLGVVFLLAQLF